MFRRVFVLIVGLVLGSTSVIAQQPTSTGASAPDSLSVMQAAKDVYFIKGGSNAVFVVGSDGVILIDTLTPGHADAIKQQIAAVTPLPIKYVINTHFHQDHTGSNEPFGLAGIPIVAQENTLKLLSTTTHNLRGDAIAPAPMAARPTVTYKNAKTISIPGVTAELIYAPAGHTNGDTYVWLPKQNVIVAGDLLHANEYPFLDVPDGGTVDGNLRAKESMLKHADNNTVILPGHGAPFTKQQLKAYLDMMYRIRSAVAKLIKEGKSEDEVVAQKLLQDDQSVPPGGPDNRDMFIRFVYQAQQSKH